MTFNDTKRRELPILSLAKQVNKEHNPCQIRGGTCLRGRVLGMKQNFCCQGCVHLGPNGCKLQQQPLGCTLFVCKTAIEANKQAADLLFGLYYEATALGLPMPIGHHAGEPEADLRSVWLED